MSRRIVRYEPNAILRYCDECGGRFRATELIQGSDRLFRCVQFCFERTMLDVDRAAASVHRQREAPPPPFGQSYDWRYTWPSEVYIYNLIVNQIVKDASMPGGIRQGAAPFPGVSLSMTDAILPFWGPTKCQCAGESLIYLYGIIAQNKRPADWITGATRKLKELADFLLAAQSTNAIFRGAYSPGTDNSISAYTMDEAVAGLGMLRAYQVTGKVEYLNSAKLCARFLTNYIRLDLLTSGYTVSGPASTTRYFYGAVPLYAVYPTGTYSEQMYPSASFAVLEFFHLLNTLAGDSAYGDNAGGNYISSPSTLASVSMAAIRSFWATAQYDYGLLAKVNGFSSVTPYSYWLPTVQGGSGANVWARSGNTVSGQDYSWALRSLYAYEGNSSQVQDVYSYLMGFSPNPAYATSADAYLPSVAESQLGTYNPKIALAYTLNVATRMNQDSIYYPASAGCLAAMADRQNLNAAKQYVGEKAFLDMSNVNSGTTVPAYFPVIGLGFQAYGQSVVSVVDAAMFGNVYRYQQYYGGYTN